MSDENQKMINITEEELGLLAICAIRYCHGRQTYMPGLIQEIVKKYLADFSNRDLTILTRDCKYQADMELWGDVVIDKPGWIKYEETLKEECEKRGMDV